jgi:hypothetical protein
MSVTVIPMAVAGTDELFVRQAVSCGDGEGRAGISSFPFSFSQFLGDSLI